VRMTTFFGGVADTMRGNTATGAGADGGRVA
jgi:hypothetical protein